MNLLNNLIIGLNIGLFYGLSGLICIATIVIAIIAIIGVLRLTVSHEKKYKSETAIACRNNTTSNNVAENLLMAQTQPVAKLVVVDNGDIALVAKVEPVKIEPIVEAQPEPVRVEPIVETQPEPVKIEPIIEAQPEPVKVEPIVVAQPEPASVEPIVEAEPIVEVVKKPATPPKRIKKVAKKPDNWSNYDGNFEGYYYDAEDACYYEGEAPEELKAKIAEKESEYQEANRVAGKKEVLIKRIAPPFATLKTAKHRRQAPSKVAGFDEAVIYGKYVIEHVGEEYFYTLYNDKDKPMYLSGNYASLEYAEKAIHRFRAHVIIGSFTVEEAEGKFHFVLKRKTYTHRGDFKLSRIEAETHVSDIKKFALSDIIRVQ